MIEIDPKIFETDELMFRDVKLTQHFSFDGQLYRKLLSVVMQNDKPCNAYCVATGGIIDFNISDVVRPVKVKVMKA